MVCSGVDRNKLNLTANHRTPLRSRARRRFELDIGRRRRNCHRLQLGHFVPQRRPRQTEAFLQLRIELAARKNHGDHVLTVPDACRVLPETAQRPVPRDLLQAFRTLVRGNYAIERIAKQAGDAMATVPLLSATVQQLLNKQSSPHTPPSLGLFPM